MVYDILPIIDQSWNKKEERKKIEKYFISSCLRKLKIVISRVKSLIHL